MRFRFRYDALLRYRGYRRDHVRALFAGILHELDDLQRRRNALKSMHASQCDEMRRMTGAGRVDVDAAASRRYHAGNITVDMLALDRDIFVVEEQLNACRAALTEAEQDVESLGRLKEKQRREFDAEALRREQRQMEDAWISSRFEEFAA